MWSNCQYLSYRRLLHQKMGQNFARVLMVPSEVVQLRRTTSGDVARCPKRTVLQCGGCTVQLCCVTPGDVIKQTGSCEILRWVTFDQSEKIVYTIRDPQLRPIRGLQIVSDRYIHTQIENQHTVRPCSTSSVCKMCEKMLLRIS